jgi:hypothetical protein
MECPVCLEEKLLVACDKCNQGVCRECSLQLDKCPVCETEYSPQIAPFDYGPCCLCIMFLTLLVLLWQIYVKIRLPLI